MTTGDLLYNVFSRRSPHARPAFALITAIVALMLASLLMFGTQPLQGAEAAIYVDSEQAQSVSSDEAADDGAEAAGEEIDDDETPMSSGLEGGELAGPSDGGIDFTWVVVGGIAVVVVFFAAKTLRLNSSIKKMNDTFR